MTATAFPVENMPADMPAIDRRPTIPKALPGEPRPFDLRTLHEAAARAAGVVVHHPTNCRACGRCAVQGVCVGVSGLAKMLGVNRKLLERASATGFTTGQADALAGRLRLHPSWVWDHWWSVDAPAGPLELDQPRPRVVVPDEELEQRHAAARRRWWTIEPAVAA
jgi:hypothetical protein